MGGGKAVLTSTPKGKSDAGHEILPIIHDGIVGHIGHNCDVPAGDIGVGGKLDMFGMYKKLQNDFQAGVLTGKGLSYGGSLIRQGNGYGLVYFARC